MSDRPLPVIPIRTLLRAGVLTAAGDSVKFKCPNVDGTIQAMQGEGFVISVSIPDGTYKFQINLVSRKRKYGNRLFYRCWQCNHDRNWIVITDHRILCSNCFKQMHDLPGSKAHRRNRFSAALALLRNERKKRPLKKPGPRPAHVHSGDGLQRDPRLSTEHALELGRGAGDYGIVQQYRLDGLHTWVEADLPQLYRRPDMPQSIVEAPILDLRVICRKFRLEQGRMSAFTLGWSLLETYNHEILVILDWRGVRPFLMIAHRRDLLYDPRWQRVEIIMTFNGRLRFVCPVTGQNCDSLYLRDSFFASWQAQRLFHPSQRSVGRRVRRSQHKKDGAVKHQE